MAGRAPPKSPPGRRPRGIVAAVTAVTVTALVWGGLGPTSLAGAAPSVPTSGPARSDGATTLAGTGTPGFAGDGGPAIHARLDAPAGIAEDAAGDLFIADAGNCRVREVPARTGRSFGHRVREGQILTLLGGPCRDVRANPAPTAVAVDGAGDLFIAYATANRVEELPATAGTTFGHRGRAGVPVLVAGTGVPGSGGDDGGAVHAELDEPTGVAVDGAGDLLIADTANCRVRLVAASDGIRFGVDVVRGDIYTVAGSGICGSAGDGGPARQAQLWDPGALAVDAHGDVLVADQGNRSIRLLAARSATFYGVAIGADDLGTVAGEGSYGPYLSDGLPALGQTAEINFPTGIAVDANGDLYIADGSMHAIRLVPAGPTTLLGKPAQPGDMYTVAGALSTGTGFRRTPWVQTRRVDPSGVAGGAGGRLIYRDAGADVVRQLPPGR